jgi:hypothetical protein
MPNTKDYKLNRTQTVVLWLNREKIIKFSVEHNLYSQSDAEAKRFGLIN